MVELLGIAQEEVQQQEHEQKGRQYQIRCCHLPARKNQAPSALGVLHLSIERVTWPCV
jgi:hypothetical protein